MGTATLVAENLSQFCPVTNHYLCSDGRYLLVTYPRLDVLGTLAGLPGMTDTLRSIGLSIAPVSIKQIHDMPTEVFLADEHATVLDADGDPANGMTPLLRCDGPVPIADALASLGYTLTDPPEQES